LIECPHRDGIEHLGSKLVTRLLDLLGKAIVDDASDLVE